MENQTKKNKKKPNRITLGQIKDTKEVSILPNKYKSMKFLHYSVPSFSNLMPVEEFGSEIATSKFIVSEGDVLLSRINPHINRVWIVRDGENKIKIASKEWEIFPKLDGLDPNYLSLFLSQRKIIEYMVNNSSGIGSSLSRTSRKALDSIEIPLPKYETQQEIVKQLNKKLHSFIESNSRLEFAIDTLEEYRRQASYEILTRQDISSPPDGYSELNNLIKVEKSRRFKEIKLHELCEKISVGNVSSISDKYRETGIPLIRSQNIRANFLDINEVKYIDEDTHMQFSNSKVVPGDILIVRTGKVGESAVVPVDLPEANCSDILILKSPKVSPSYLSYYINSVLKDTLQNISYGTVITHLNSSTLSQILVTVPSDSEIKNIVESLDKLNDSINKIQKDIRKSLDELKNLRINMIDEVFEDLFEKSDDSGVIRRIKTSLAGLENRRKREKDFRDNIKVELPVKLDVSANNIISIIKSQSGQISTSDILDRCGYNPSDGVEALEEFYRNITIAYRDGIISRNRVEDSDFFGSAQ